MHRLWNIRPFVIITGPFHHVFTPRMSGRGVEFQREIFSAFPNNDPQEPYAALVEYLSDLYHLTKWGGKLFHAGGILARDEKKMTMTPKTPLLTVDIIIHPEGDRSRVVLIERAFPPLGLALPGGFVDVGERVEDAARREALEETGLVVSLEALLGCYSDPARDPRQHTVSLVYVAQGTGSPHAGDDARRCFVMDADRLTAPLVFDHDRIMRDYRMFVAGGDLPVLWGP